VLQESLEKLADAALLMLMLLRANGKLQIVIRMPQLNRGPEKNATEPPMQ
jgi:hypothetical protein